VKMSLGGLNTRMPLYEEKWLWMEFVKALNCVEGLKNMGKGEKRGKVVNCIAIVGWWVKKLRKNKDKVLSTNEKLAF